MSSAAAFSATYSDFKLVRSRKVVQLVFELPIEQSGMALDALGGMPNPASEVWCAIARLNAGAEPASSTPAVSDSPTAQTRKGYASTPSNQVDLDREPHQADPTPPSGGVKRSPAQQAGWLCRESAFQKYLFEMHGCPERTPEAAAEFVRNWCGVISRAEIVPGSHEARLWRELYEGFLAWQQYPEIVE